MKFVMTLKQALLLFLGVAIVTFCTPYRASAQDFSNLLDNLELSGGFNHETGDFGLNGFTAAAGVWLGRRAQIDLDYDSAYHTSTLGVLSLTSIGHTAIKNRIQDWLIGPRIFFTPRQVDRYRFSPFAEFKLGGSHLSERIQETSMPSQAASDNAFAWALGGGADYQFNSQWFGRVDLDLLRTHFADAGQSRLRLVLGIGYTFGGRPSTR
ncbi:MAG TPA: hypothetical protein VF133_01935 [Terriglobales bacterium]|jgi:hypothetical protein